MNHEAIRYSQPNVHHHDYSQGLPIITNFLVWTMDGDTHVLTVWPQLFTATHFCILTVDS